MLSFKALAIFLLAVLFTACTSPNPSSEEDDIRAKQAYSAAATKSPTFSPLVGDTFSWYENGIIWSVPEGEPDANMLISHMMGQVKELLEKRGYRFTTDASNATYVLGLAVLDNQVESSKRVSQFFQVAPGMNAAEQDRTATVIAAVAKNNAWVLESGSQAIRNNLLWRSSVEAFVIEGLEPEERLRRIDRLTQVLMGSFPSGK
ncbi:hypothetical protein [Teredinibacter franksiae]|jgi:hypothetical protein|uniref:hypothetical protein n=1 Tax=Teredinibacter franksiae TaxID=2761453 RepID=UPI0016249EAC|nr:hypothetical protein [Teredinibacter franksiae]